MFTQEHPDVPLAWIVSSRPERHICDTFNEATVRGRYDSESIPIDSTDSSVDVKRFLRDNFDSIQREFPSLPLRNWPEETAIAKLTNAALGLFIFAEPAIRFIRNPDHAYPVPRLRLVLSVIDRAAGVYVKRQSFALLDDLYTEILSNIPSDRWPTTKLLMRLALSFRSNGFLGFSSLSKSRTLKGMANSPAGL